MPPDYHIHTELCRHAKGAPAEFRQAAARTGIGEMCFTDHCPEPSGYDARHRMTMDQFADYRGLVDGLQDGSSPAVLLGIEADYFPGAERFLSKWLPQHPFDLVLGSIHYIRDWGFDNPDERRIWESVDVTGVWRTYFGLLASLIETRMFDVIGHFDLPKKFGHRLRDKPLTEMVQPVLDRVAAAGMAIEINTSGWRRDVAEAYPSQLILGLARDRGIPVTFGSDAHAPGDVGFEFQRAIRWAKETGYTGSLVFRGRQPVPVAFPG